MSDNTSIQTVTNENVDSVLQEVQEAFYDIPFENSQFQTENFVIAAQVTPERAYRSIGLRIHSKIQAVLEAKHGRAKEDIDIEELQAKIDNPDTSEFDRRRAQLDIDFKLANRPYTDKLMNDALTELNILYAHFQKLPRYTREQFELGEREHFDIKLNRQLLGVQGAAEALENMNTDLPSFVRLEQELRLLK
jgi:hypothetical protein